MMGTVKATSEHLFDNNEICSAWCKQKQQNEDEIKILAYYYQSKERDAKLYAQLYEDSQDFLTEKRLLEINLPFDIQTVEGMISPVAKHASKHNIYGTTSSLRNRMNITVGVQLWE